MKTRTFAEWQIKTTNGNGIMDKDEGNRSRKIGPCLITRRSIGPLVKQDHVQI